MLRIHPQSLFSRVLVGVYTATLVAEYVAEHERGVMHPARAIAFGFAMLLLVAECAAVDAIVCLHGHTYDEAARQATRVCLRSVAVPAYALAVVVGFNVLSGTPLFDVDEVIATAFANALWLAPLLALYATAGQIGDLRRILRKSRTGSTAVTP